jgi:hypothetical protein
MIGSATPTTVLPQAVAQGTVLSSAIAPPASFSLVVAAGLMSAADASDPTNVQGIAIEATHDNLTWETMDYEPAWNGGLDKNGQPSPPGLTWQPGVPPLAVRIRHELGAKAASVGSTLAFAP